MQSSLSVILLFSTTSANKHTTLSISFWSIAVQVQLYALYPLLIALTARFGWRRSLLGIAAIEISLRLTDGILFTTSGTGLPRWLTGSPLMYWLSWSLGAIVAECYIRGVSLSIPRMFLFAPAVFAIFSGFFKPLSSMMFLFYALFIAGVVAKLLQKADRKISIPDFLRNHLQQVGLWSYSIYLLHYPLLLIVPIVAFKILPSAYSHPFTYFVLCSASWILIVPIAGLFYRFVELPSIALGKRLLAPNAPSQALQQDGSTVTASAPTQSSPHGTGNTSSAGPER